MFVGGASNDQIDGGNGTDTVDYSQETGDADVFVNLFEMPIFQPQFVDSRQAHDTHGNTDTLTSIEHVITGSGNDTLSGGFGIDVLTGGVGNDTFKETAAGLNGDTITDFGAGDTIIITDASLSGFTYNLSGHTLTYSGGSLTLSAPVQGHLMAQAAVGGGVQLTVIEQTVHNDFSGDGRNDVLWRNDSGRVTDWLGQANSGFVSNFANADANAGTDWHIDSTGDFNGDGIDDILWRNDNGDVTNWLGHANGGFTSNFGSAYYQVDNSWHVQDPVL